MRLRKVLFVDDNETSRFLVRRLIARENFAEQTVCAKNGEEGLSFVMSEQFDLVLLDLNMPVMNGFELLDALAGEFEGELTVIPPIFILSSSSNSRDMETVRRYHFVKGYLSKPLEKGHLDQIRSLI
ncbi:response regulator [Nibribacter koreensis]|uniref:Response regulator n=1 Tax=Nibribacter koreensis TaxID=1084519 RepID=A0ABP8F6P6_9BACT